MPWFGWVLLALSVIYTVTFVIGMIEWYSDRPW